MECSVIANNSHKPRGMVANNIVSKGIKIIVISIMCIHNIDMLTILKTNVNKIKTVNKH